MRLMQIKEVQTLLLDLMKEVHDFLKKNNLQYYLLGGSALGAVRHNGFIPWDDDIDIGMMRSDYERFLQISDSFNSKFEIVNFSKSNKCDYGLTRIYISNTYIDNPVVAKTKLDTRLYFDVFPIDNVPDENVLLNKYETAVKKKKRIIQYLDLRNYGDSKPKLFFKKLVSLCLSPFRKRILSSFDKLQKKYQHSATVRVCSLCSQYSFNKQVMARTIYGAPTLHKFEDVDLFIPEKINDYLTTLFGSDYMELPPEHKRRKGFDIYILDEE